MNEKSSAAMHYSEEEVERYMQKSLESTQRSCQVLNSCEKLGTETAQELLVQREKLERANKNLEDIEHTAKLSQRNLNSLSSFFGGLFRNVFSSSKPTKKGSDGGKGTKVSALQETTVKVAQGVASPRTDFANSHGSLHPSLNQTSRGQIKGTRMEVVDRQIDKNLGEMSSQVSRLRMLGLALGEELDSQDKLIDRVQHKTDRNENTVRRQRRQVDRLLK